MSSLERANNPTISHIVSREKLNNLQEIVGHLCRMRKSLDFAPLSWEISHIMYTDDEKELARKIDPECWQGLQGQKPYFKAMMEQRRKESLQEAEGEVAQLVESDDIDTLFIALCNRSEKEEWRGHRKFLADILYGVLKFMDEKKITTRDELREELRKLTIDPDALPYV